MQKTINIYQNARQLSPTVYNVHIDKLEAIPNYSINQILSPAINYIDINHIPLAIHTICQKLKLDGSCTIDIVNMKSICTDYTHGAIVDNEIFELLNNRANYVSIPTIKSIVEKDINLAITHISTNKHITSIRIERIKL
mgnify:CR=1 FL=1